MTGLNSPALLVLISSLLVSTSVAAADAVGAVVFARGDVAIEPATGETRSAVKGDDLMHGELVSTGAASIAVIRLQDDSRLVLRPHSEFRVERLVTEAEAADNGVRPSAVLNLLRGGVRLVTGLIGRLNPAGYRLDTPVATIGIRGTGFSTRLCASDCAAEQSRLAGRDAAADIGEGLYVNVDDGRVFLDNEAPGEPLDLVEGESGYVADSTSQPVKLAVVPAFLGLDAIPSPGQLDFDNIEIPDNALQVDEPGDEAAALAAASAGTGDAAATGITGTYAIDVDYDSDLPLADRKWFFGTSPDIEISLTQQGNDIKGELSGDRDGVIEGKIDGKVVTYKLWLEARGGEIKEGEGTWTVRSKDRLEGDFNIRDRERGIVRGDVTLVRVGSSGSSAFGIDALFILVAFCLVARLARGRPRARFG